MRRITTFIALLAFVLVAGISLAEFIFVDVEPEDTEQPLILDDLEWPGQPVDDTAPIEILITATGDVTLGGNMKKNPKSNIYTEQLGKHQNDLGYFFENVYDLFASDDLTLINFEGTLTNVSQPANDNSFHFRAPPEHVQALTMRSVEAVALENNHVMDFGRQGYEDTVATLTSQGIVYASDGKMGVYETKGVSIAMLAYQTFDGAYARLFEQVPLDIAAAREAHDLVIVSYHWGAELHYAPNENQIKLGRLTIDAGADLVLGHHSHRVNPIERYRDRYIVYSLANCSFSGNSRPEDMDTFLFQQKFTISSEGVTPGAFRVIPASISSVTGRSGKETGENDFAVTPFEEGSAGAQRVIEKLIENGKKLTYAVDTYPTQWQ